MIELRKRQAVALVRTVDLQANRAVRVGSERGCNEDQAAQSGSRMCVDMLSPSDPTSALAGAAEVENSDSILRGYSGGPQFGGPAADKPGRPASERATAANFRGGDGHPERYCSTASCWPLVRCVWEGMSNPVPVGSPRKSAAISPFVNKNPHQRSYWLGRKLVNDFTILVTHWLPSARG